MVSLIPVSLHSRKQSTSLGQTGDEHERVDSFVMMFLSEFLAAVTLTQL